MARGRHDPEPDGAVAPDAAARAGARRELTPEEAKAIDDNSPAVATPREDHQKKSRTYGGRNNPEQVAEDAMDLKKAQKKDDDAIGDNPVRDDE